MIEMTEGKINAETKMIYLINMEFRIYPMEEPVAVIIVCTGVKGDGQVII